MTKRTLMILVAALSLSGCGMQNQTDSTTSDTSVSPSAMGSSTVADLNESSFEKQVLEAKTPVLVDFYATWCGPCRQMAPVVDALAARYKNKLKVYRVNIDDSPSLAEKYQVQAIPNLILFKNGDVVDDMIGARDGKQISDRLDSMNL